MSEEEKYLKTLKEEVHKDGYDIGTEIYISNPALFYGVNQQIRDLILTSIRSVVIIKKHEKTKTPVAANLNGAAVK